LVLTIFVILFLILLYPIFLFFSTPYIFCPVLRTKTPSVFEARDNIISKTLIWI